MYLTQSFRRSLQQTLERVATNGGKHIFSAEVENAIARHPAVARCDAPYWTTRIRAVN